MRDFTFQRYKQLLLSIKKSGYTFQTFDEFLQNPSTKVVVMRHDSDIWPWNDQRMAEIENELSIKATYYFRVPETFDKKIISRIAELGHEIGYHYEDLARFNGDYNKAITNFQANLNLLRKMYPVATAVMHGRPLSKWDSRKLWEKYKLNSFGLRGEPYLSVNYNKVYYLTDNGNRWDGEKYSIRDKVKTNFAYDYRTTWDLIKAFDECVLPAQIIINVHPARWNDNLIIWTYRFFLQKAKNFAKQFLKKIR